MADVVSETVLGVIMGPEMIVARCRSLYWALHTHANPCGTISNDHQGHTCQEADAESNTNIQLALDKISAMSSMSTAASGRQVARMNLRAILAGIAYMHLQGGPPGHVIEKMCYSHTKGRCLPAVV